MTSEPQRTSAGRLPYEPSEADGAFCAKRETSVKRFAHKAPVVQAKLILKKYYQGRKYPLQSKD